MLEAEQETRKGGGEQCLLFKRRRRHYLYASGPLRLPFGSEQKASAVGQRDHL